MSRLNKLTPILDLAERNEELAAKALGAAQQRLEAARGSLDNLHNFRRNYAEQFEQSAQQGISVQRLNEFRGFLHKINKAIAEQERAVAKAEADLAALRHAWEEAHRKVLGMQKVVEKLAIAEQIQEQKREQNEQDDRVGSRRGSGIGSLSSVFI